MEGDPSTSLEPPPFFSSRSSTASSYPPQPPEGVPAIDYLLLLFLQLCQALPDLLEGTLEVIGLTFQDLGFLFCAHGRNNRACIGIHRHTPSW